MQLQCSDTLTSLVRKVITLGEVTPTLMITYREPRNDVAHALYGSRTVLALRMRNSLARHHNKKSQSNCSIDSNS